MAEKQYICKYAGDVQDEDCKGCNGIEMDINGKMIPCTQCAGFEQGEELKDAPMPAPVEKEVEEKPKKETKKASTKPVKDEEPNNTKAKEEKAPKQAKTATEAEDTVLPDGVTVKSIRYRSGITIVHKEAYYKINAEEEWEIDPAKVKDLQDVREKLWAKVNSEVDEQIKDIKSL